MNKMEVRFDDCGRYPSLDWVW